MIGASKILRDISTRKRIEQALLQAEKIAATGRMAATIAHEINNPLEAVMNLIYLLRPMIADPAGISYFQSRRDGTRACLAYRQADSWLLPRTCSGKPCLNRGDRSPCNHDL